MERERRFDGFLVVCGIGGLVKVLEVVLFVGVSMVVGVEVYAGVAKEIYSNNISYLSEKTHILYLLSCCQYKKTQMTQYKDFLHQARHDLDKELDVVNIIRRLRMHGLALEMLLYASQKSDCAQLAEK